jgi:ClpP class serine protease
LAASEKKSILNSCRGLSRNLIKHVKTHRGNKLKINDKILNGEVYFGEDSIGSGLADEVDSMLRVQEERVPRLITKDRINVKGQNQNISMICYIFYDA